MYQLIALFRVPGDTAGFDAAYTTSHLPLARKIPGVLSLTVSKIVPGRDGYAQYYQVATLNFADKDAFKTAMKSPENAAAGENLQQIAPGLVEFYTAETLESA